MNKFLKLKSAFTLAELLIVIIIIAVLAAVVLVAVNPAEQRAKALMSAGRTNLSSVCRAQALCAVENEVSDCSDFVSDGGIVDVADPGDGTWVYTFTGDASGTVEAEATIGGAVFTLTCQNVDATNRGQVRCSDDGAGTYDCEALGFDALFVD